MTCRNRTPLVSTLLECENNEKMIEFLKKSISIKYFLELENTKTGEIIKKYITPNTIKGTQSAIYLSCVKLAADLMLDSCLWV